MTLRHHCLRNSLWRDLIKLGLPRAERTRRPLGTTDFEGGGFKKSSGDKKSSGNLEIYVAFKGNPDLVLLKQNRIVGGRSQALDKAPEQIEQLLTGRAVG